MNSFSGIELSKSALQQNIAFIKSLLPAHTVLAAVVKGNAYGHGLETFVPVAAACGINKFFVFNSQEAARMLPLCGDNGTVVITGVIEESEIEWAIRNKVECYVFDVKRLLAILRAAKKAAAQAIIHLEVETGLNRLGLTEQELPEVLALVRQNREWLVVEGLCTHLAGAESVSNDFRIRQQLEKYNQLYNLFCENKVVPRVRHCASSAAVLNYPESHMDLVRVGVMLYGFWPNKETLIFQVNKTRKYKAHFLRSVLTWKSYVLSIKKVSVGEFIGYGTSYQAAATMLVGAIPVGYGYGYSRSLSNVGKVLIGGVFADIIGYVSMNLLLVDVTHLPGVTTGAEAVLIGRQQDNAIEVASFSDSANGINYEMLTRLPGELTRVVTE
jgi:alanine racemase